MIAREAQRVLLTQLKQATYFAVILDCIPDISHQDKLTVILRFVQCNNKSGVNVKKAFLGILRVNDSIGKCFLNVFLKRSKDLELNLSDCGGQYYDNGANMKRKEAGLQARFLRIDS